MLPGPEKNPPSEDRRGVSSLWLYTSSGYGSIWLCLKQGFSANQGQAPSVLSAPKIRQRPILTHSEREIGLFDSEICWLRGLGSNQDRRLQRPLSYHWTTPESHFHYRRARISKSNAEGTRRAAIEHFP